FTRPKGIDDRRAGQPSGQRGKIGEKEPPSRPEGLIEVDPLGHFAEQALDELARQLYETFHGPGVHLFGARLHLRQPGANALLGDSLGGAHGEVTQGVSLFLRMADRVAQLIDGTTRDLPEKVVAKLSEPRAQFPLFGHEEKRK